MAKKHSINNSVFVAFIVAVVIIIIKVVEDEIRSKVVTLGKKIWQEEQVEANQFQSFLAGLKNSVIIVIVIIVIDIVIIPIIKILIAMTIIPLPS